MSTNEKLKSEFPEYYNWDDIKYIDHVVIEEYVNSRITEFINHYKIDFLNKDFLDFNLIDICVINEGLEYASPKELSMIVNQSSYLSDHFDHFDEVKVCCIALELDYTLDQSIDLLAEKIGWGASKPSEYIKVYKKLVEYQKSMI